MPSPATSGGSSKAERNVRLLIEIAVTDRSLARPQNPARAIHSEAQQCIAYVAAALRERSDIV